MSNPEQTVPVDFMIRRLEEANAGAHQRAARAHERISDSEQDTARHPSDQQKSSVVPASRGWLTLGVIGLLFAASLGVVAAKLINSRWSLVQTTGQSTPASISPELAQRLQTDLANVAQRIEQLRISQEQMVRDQAAVAGQLKAAVSQMTRDHAAVVEQLRANQEQMMRLTATRARR